jgi:hypothetical protein
MDNQTTAVPYSIDAEIEIILKEMLEHDEEITARAVVRRHSKLKAASSITRSSERTALIANYQEKQVELRNWQKRVGKKSKENIAKALAERDDRITELERQVDILTASHVAMIRAVGELGGFSKWAKFFKDHVAVLDALHKLGAMPEKL